MSDHDEQLITRNPWDLQDSGQYGLHAENDPDSESEDDLAVSPLRQPHERKKTTHLNFLNNTVGDVARQHNGNIVNNSYYYYSAVEGYTGKTRVVSEDFALFTNEDISERERALTKTNLQFQALRSPLPAVEPLLYQSYASVKSSRVRHILRKIAELLRFLDRGFAEYYQLGASTFDHELIGDQLSTIKDSIRMRQQSQSKVRPQAATDSVWLGDLGHFCEEIAKRTERQNQGLAQSSLKFKITNSSQELRYLQDALEVPYWTMLLNLFLDWRANTRNLMADVILRVLSHFKVEVLNLRHQLRVTLKELEESEPESIEPILLGIDTRIDVLQGAWDENTSQIADLLQSCFETENNNVESAVQSIVPVQSSQTVYVLSLTIIALVAAMVPAFIAFAKSMESTEAGSTSDSDFWYLISSSIMAVLGSGVLTLQLMKESWLSPAYTTTWIFTALGVICAILSIAIYPLCNTGWSSILSFFGSIMSQGAVLVMTQAVARPAPPIKLKQS
ncbi:hypothetical protein HII31_00389 [Pseudocercospora fuligena]|uniref:Uncharacterized protein n=1 Tax=Pseudocercospora fuligena TaxID=685502 RepID=A0A8H6VTX2_9PEZI|nr:hypothetical protein HII31_00389 [Pseudocercospora fuligena]